jgi:prolyl-tRNA editing enzyme YbaK/EbsC (Cys-tRNA(Pro) deacylase)
MNIFISHSSSQKPLVRDIAKCLPKWIKIWVDEYELNYGDELSASLQHAIEDNVDYVLVIITKDSIGSSWVKKEVNWALSYEEQLGRTFVIPIVVGLPTNKLKEFGLNERLAINIHDYTEVGIKSISDKLILSLSRLIDKRLLELKTGCLISSFNDTINDIVNNLQKVPYEYQDKVEALLLRDLSIASQFARFGEIHIYPSVYYRMLLENISMADENTEVLAISLLKSAIWSNLDDQIEYARKNFQAVQKGAAIKRLFLVVPEEDQSFRSIIEEQSKNKINVKINRPSLNSTAHLEDCVIFKNGANAIVLIGHQDRENPKGGLLSARVIISQKRCLNYIDEFNKAWDISEKSLGELSTISYSDAPGKEMIVYSLNEAVISCADAASARGIPLESELKSLILETSKGRFVVHIPGDGLVDLRRVKNFLDVKEAYVLDPELLASDYDLSPGRVSAVLEPVWSLPHLVSKRLLTLNAVYTNNKTFFGYFKFAPTILMQAKRSEIGEFEKTIG